MAFIFSLWSETLSNFFDSVLWGEGAAVFLPEQPRPKLPLGLCHLEEGKKKHVLCPPSPHVWGWPASIGDWPAGPAPYSCSPILKQTHSRRQLFSSQMMIAEQQKAQPEQLESTKRVRDIFQMQARGHCSTSSSLWCSLQGQETWPGQVRCTRAPFGPGSPMGTGFRQLAVCSR